MKNRMLSLLKGLFYTIMIIIVLAPLFFCLMNSFKSTSELIHSYISFPTTLSFENYIYVINEKKILNYLINSFVITITGTMISFLINPFISFMIASNWNDKRYKALYLVLSACMLIPSNMLVFPLIRIYYKIGLMNIGGLFLYYSVFMIPENVFMLVPFFRTFNNELFGAASMDGCSVMRFYRKVFLPVCKPYVIAILILNFVWIWNDFFMPLMILNKNPDLWTLPIFIYNFLGRNSAHKNYAFASCQIALLPVIILYVIFHRNIITGLGIKINRQTKGRN